MFFINICISHFLYIQHYRNMFCENDYIIQFVAAYISPDTLVLRENGNFSFKAIPEDKPLEVIFMAPELQQKGKLSDKVPTKH